MNLEILLGSLIVIFLAGIKAEVYILQPYWLKEEIGNNGKLNVSLGNYGHLQYGTSVNAKMFYPKENQDGCREFKDGDFDDEDRDDPLFKNKQSILVQRGNCSFVTKTLNIQKFGGIFALISDNIEESEQDIIMIDQNNEGEQVHIATYLINSKEGKTLMSASIGVDIVLKSSLEIAKNSNFITFELWYGGIWDFKDIDILEVQDVVLQLKNNTMMRPRIYTWNCEGQCDETIKKSFCISNGKYCPMTPYVHSAQASDIKIKLANEALTQKCLWEYTLENDNVMDWFSYMNGYYQNCYIADTFLLTNITQECSNMILTELGIPINTIRQCVQNSFVTPGDFNSDNTILRFDRSYMRAENVRIAPQITIEGYPYRGEFDSYDLKNAICSGFKKSPKSCKQFKVTQSGIDRLQTLERRQVVFAEVFVAVVFVLLINIGLIIAFRQYQKNKRKDVMKVVINNEVSKYFKISNNDVSQGNIDNGNGVESTEKNDITTED